MSPLSNSKFLQVMAFYLLLSFIIGPLVGFYTLGKSAVAAGNGWAIGSVLSVILWYSVGKKMVRS